MKIFRFVYILVSYLMLASIFFINHDVAIGTIVQYFGLTEVLGMKMSEFDYPNIISFPIYILFPIFATWLLGKIMRKIKDVDGLKAEHIAKCEYVGGDFLASFLAYVFVGLSINTLWSLSVVYVFIVIFCYCSNIYLYNPMFYLIGYKYYYVTTTKNIKVLIMSRQKVKCRTGNVEFKELVQINDSTYIELTK